MATTAETVIENARDYHASFSRQKVPDLGALRSLERLQQQLAQAVVEANPEAIATWYEIALPEDWEDGVAIPANLGVLGVESVYDEDGSNKIEWEVSILSPNQTLTQPHMYPSVYVTGSTLHLTDMRRWYGDLSGWEELTTLRVRYVPAMTTLASLGSLLTLPDSAASALEPLLALWMANRTGTPLPGLVSEAGAAAASWVSHMGSLAAQTWVVEVVE